MTTQLEAVYEQGVPRPLKPLDWPEGTRVEITVVRSTPSRTPYEILSAIAALPLEVTREERAGHEASRQNDCRADAVAKRTGFRIDTPAGFFRALAQEIS